MSESLSLTNLERERAFHSGRKRLFIGAGILLLLALALYGCMHAVKNGERQAFQLDTDFHTAVARHDWDSIYENADGGYKDAVSKEDSAALFSGLVVKLGTPVDCKQGGTMVS